VHLPQKPFRPAGLGQLVTIRIEISFLEDAILPSVFAIPFA
jgi:hypothetical protein